MAGFWNKLSTTKRMIVGYFLIIMAGAVLLCLPFATRSGEGTTSFLDALFTATSATCVTGLVVVDTWTHWTGFGQGVILFLIQVGGLGFITMAVAVVAITRRRIGLKERVLMQESISAPHTGGIVRLTRFVFRITLLIEGLGALLLSIRFIPRFGFPKGVYFSVFHSISAFCNAGFDLMGCESPYSSLTAFAGDPIVSLTVMMLIVVGGLGFFVWEDLWRHNVHWRRFTLQTKMVLITTGTLILLPALFFFFTEAGNPDFNSGIGQRVLTSLFASVTPRTAGFNTVDIAAMTQPGQLLTIILMIIGGSPGSTAGGMKTTTLTVLLLCVLSMLKQREDVEAYGRRVGFDVLRRAVSLLMLYTTLFITGGLAISLIESLPVLPCLFETASAIGTVGLTMGITTSLGSVSHIILISLMFFGRLGGLTMLYAVVNSHTTVPSRLPLENISVG